MTYVDFNRYKNNLIDSGFCHVIFHFFIEKKTRKSTSFIVIMAM